MNALPLIIGLQLASPGDPCTTPEYRQFDFWTGHWEVIAGDKVAGDNRVERILDGCAIAEHWTGTSGVVGRSYSAYSAQTRRWHQFWVSGHGGVLYLEGGLADGNMVLSGERPDPATGRAQLQRVTWSPKGENVRQLWETSDDDGKTWTVVFDGQYHPHK